MRYIERDRGRKPSAVTRSNVMVRSMLLPAFGELQLAVRFGPRPRCVTCRRHSAAPGRF